MSDFPALVILSTVMGLVIFVSLPVVLAKAMASRTILFLNAGAIGILVFLMGDIFSDAASILYPGGVYVANLGYTVLFLLGLVGAFGILYVLERGPSEERPASANRLALIVALAIGFQNLTEGLVFGATWAVGLTGVLWVIFVGFALQNVTEGFPIASPFLGSERPDLGRLVAFFLVGGVPTVVGGVVGYFWSSDAFNVFFDALAIGAILYAILPMLKMTFRPGATREESRSRMNLVYAGVLVGFAIGFAVNAI